MDKMEDTIVGISTPIGKGAIGIIRISGYKALIIIDKIFKNSKKRNKFKSHTINHGYIVSGKDIVDEVLVSVMYAPRTYTCENIVEINCHGGIKSLQLILDLVLKNGARLAEPGEFTKRAFINGRIDLIQAESVIDIINAKTKFAHELAIKGLKGCLSEEVNIFREDILKMIANIEVSIDYPEHDMEYINIKEINEKIKNLINKIDKLIKNIDKYKILKEGLNVVILGKPNVGKSSLLNLMIGEERAIVTNIEGTTRDILRESIDLDGIPLIINDTAGIRKTDNDIEKIGIEKSKILVKEADLILLLVDVSQELSNEDIEIFKIIKEKEKIIIMNKCDLGEIIKINILKKYFEEENIVKISIKEKKGIEELYNKIKCKFLSRDIEINNEIILGNVRHKSSLLATKESLNIVLDTIKNGFTEDLMSIDLKNAYQYLGEIIGETLREDIIDKIFSEFCLGK